MFAWLRSLISADAVVELHSSHMCVRDVSNRMDFEFEPLLSVDSDQRVVSVGHPIPASAVRLARRSKILRPLLRTQGSLS